MAKLAFLLALVQAVHIYGLPTRDQKRKAEGLAERAITLSSNLEVTTSYSSTLETFQSATATVAPSITGVCVSSRSLCLYPTPATLAHDMVYISS